MLNNQQNDSKQFNKRLFQKVGMLKSVAMSLVLSLLFISSAHAAPTTLFEGYYKLLVDDVHTGYVIQRYSFDKGTKQYQSTYLLVSKRPEGLLQESLHAVCGDGFTPISYQYTTSDMGQVKSIDATFKGLTMTLEISNGKKKTTQKKAITKDIFLSTFLPYIILKNGVKENTNYSYKAIAEEDGSVAAGAAKTEQRTTFNNVPVFFVQNTFKGVGFNSFMSEEGHTLAAKSPLAKISTELVATPNDATKGIPVNDKTLKLLFGNIPVGQQNALSQKLKSATPEKK